EEPGISYGATLSLNNPAPVHGFERTAHVRRTVSGNSLGYTAQPPDFRRNLEAFAAGINEYAKQHADRLSADAKLVLPVTAIDVLAHEQRVINFTFVSN